MSTVTAWCRPLEAGGNQLPTPCTGQTLSLPPRLLQGVLAEWSSVAHAPDLRKAGSRWLHMMRMGRPASGV